MAVEHDGEANEEHAHLEGRGIYQRHCEEIKRKNNTTRRLPPALPYLARFLDSRTIYYPVPDKPAVQYISRCRCFCAPSCSFACACEVVWCVSVCLCA